MNNFKTISTDYQFALNGVTGSNDAFLLDNCRGSGHLINLPWDLDTFGFPVAQWSGFDGPSLSVEDWDVIKDALINSAYGVISTSVPADDHVVKYRLAEIGFRLVENSIMATCSLNGKQLPKSRFRLREAVATDIDEVCHLAGRIFSFGRYLSDAAFPSDLASKRYEDWVRRSFKSKGDRIVVYGGYGNLIQGFMIFSIVGDRLNLRLGGFDPTSPNRIYASELWSYSFEAGRQAGAKIVEVAFAAENISILNLYSAWGFRFKSVVSTFHLTQI